MGKIRNIRLFTALGLVAILALQSIWLFNTYMLVRDNILEESFDTLEESFDKEIDLRADRTPKGTQIIGDTVNDTISSLTFFNESLLELGYEMSLDDLDSIASSVLMEKYDIESTSMICVISMDTEEVLQKSKLLDISSLTAIKSKPFPIRKDLSQGIQLVLLNPYWIILERMILLIIATVIIMIMVVTCVAYQIKIIIRQDKMTKVRKDFSYAMIHDMKTPLSSILACASLLQSDKMENKPELQGKYFRIIENEGVHLQELADKVLTLSKLENNKLKLAITVLSLESMITNLIEKFTAKSAKPVHFTTHLQVKEVYADEEYLKGAISNLIDNAIKYSKESVEIDISSLSDATHVLLKVHDNGIGISKKDQKRVFEKFERASALKRSRLGKVAGFGLGLNYVYRVMEAHRGSVTVNSIEKSFSEFTLHIPNLDDD